MINIENRNSHGFFAAYRGNNLVVNSLKGVSCSQYIKQTFEHANYNIINGKIEFYYPSDWLCLPGRNLNFFNYWLDLVGRLFHKVKFVGKVKTNSLGLSFHEINGQSTGLHSKVLKLGIDGNDFMFNDEWYKFEIEISDNSVENERRHYCAYCMIRYLFSNHYDQIVKTYNRIRYSVLSYNSDISEFEILQMAHLYFPGYNFYYQTYVLVHYPNRDAVIDRLVKESEFKDKIKRDSNINNLFKSGISSGLVISEFQKMLDTNTITQIYERIKYK